MFSKRHLFGVLFLLGISLYWAAAATPAQAHSVSTVGPYTIITGWTDEPPIVGQRNAILMMFSETASGQPVVGVEAGVTAQIIYGNATYRANLNPTVVPGEYLLELIPTVRGQYNVRLTGTIGATDLDMLVEPEEVFAAARLQFPEVLPDTLAHEEQIQALQGQLQQARFMAITGITLGLMGLVLAGLQWFRKR